MRYPPGGYTVPSGRSAGELTRRMLRKKLYVILAMAQCEPGALLPYLPDHLAYMIALEKDGVLFASGPFAEPDGSQRGNGMSIVRADSAAAARRLAERDPFFIAGLRSFEVREWTLMEGAIGFTVSFSDQSIGVT